MLQNLNLYTGLTQSQQIKVKGMKGAELYPLSFGSFITLYDEEDSSIFYQKEVDILGVTSIKRFRFIEEPLDVPELKESNNYVTKDIFNASFNELKEEIRNVQQLLKQSTIIEPADKPNSANSFNNENGKGQHKSNGSNGKRS